jgi:hypothetical protein
VTYDPERDGELRSGAMNDPDDWAVIGPSFGEQGLPPGMAARIAEDVLAHQRRYGNAPPSDGPAPGPRRNRHLDGDGYGQGR